jgi:putative membrane protein
VEWTIIAVNFLYATLGVVLMYVSFRIIDRLLPHIDLEVELKQGNVAVAIVVGALFVAIAIIVGGALN